MILAAASRPGLRRGLACAAVWPGRVLAMVCMSGPAPFGAEGLDWFAGMTPTGTAEYRAAATGRAALEAYFASAEFDPGVYSPRPITPRLSVHGHG